MYNRHCLFYTNSPAFYILYVYFVSDPTFTMMHLCITQCTYWTPLLEPPVERRRLNQIATKSHKTEYCERKIFSAFHDLAFPQQDLSSNSPHYCPMVVS